MTLLDKIKKNMFYEDALSELSEEERAKVESDVEYFATKLQEINDKIGSVLLSEEKREKFFDELNEMLSKEK